VSSRCRSRHITAIAVGLGPGLFTGRVGVTTAKVMAKTLRIPVVGVPSSISWHTLSGTATASW
jgi:tRNA A37 threonylcarbamoyladenosine modification protein TsaB